MYQFWHPTGLTDPAGADKSSAQVTGLIAGLQLWLLFTLDVHLRSARRDHDLSCSCAWPTSPRPTPSPSFAYYR
jgi:hypothetical protein